MPEERSMSAGKLSEEIKRLLESLNAGEDVQKTLEMLNSMLAANPAAAQATLQVISFPLLFSFLQVEDTSQVQVVCSILDKLLCLLPGSELVQHATYMELGLQYPESQLVRTCLQALQHSSCEEAVRNMLIAPTMLHLVCQVISSQDLECATLSSKILLSVFSADAVPQAQEVFVEELRALLSQGSVVQLRVYDLCVQLCLKGGPGTAKVVMDAGFLEGLVTEMEAEDVLLKMSVIELLCGLTESQVGRDFLDISKVLEKLHSVLQSCREDAFGVVLVPGNNI